MNRAPWVFERKMSERPERSRKWSEKRLRKVFGAVRNRAPRVFEGKTVRETRAAVESEGEGNSESFRNRAPWVFEGKTVTETRAESEME